MLSDAGRQDTPTSTMANISGAHAESILAKIDGGKSESQLPKE
jgi:ubiquitin